MKDLPTQLQNLNDSELKQINGGYIGTAMAFAAMIISCAYYIGYRRGKASCEN